MATLSRILMYALAALLSLTFMAALVVAGLYLYLEPQLPAVDTLRDARLQQPLRVYSADGELMAEFGEYRREPISYEEIPERLRQAFVAAEDEHFYSHPGVDHLGMARAVLHLVRHREIGPGGSTITMQVARNFFLSREQTYLRKLNEILLAFKIERELSKEEILELYVNKIYLGQRAYGIGAAAQIYYGKSPDELDLAQLAMIAGLPKAPSAANPVSNPERALQRRAYVLRRMAETGLITAEEMAEASTQPITAVLHRVRPGLSAPFVAEMARAYAFERFGEEAYTEGYRVYTTIDSRLQRQADEALRSNLMAYDRRHGYRGPEAEHDLDGHATEEDWDELLSGVRRVGGLLPALVVEVDRSADRARVYLGRGEYTELTGADVRWARPYINQSAVGEQPGNVADVLAPGHRIRLQVVRDEDEDGNSVERFRFAQVPDIEGSLISMSPSSGAVVALAGGFDFGRSQFNRAVQALRQPGSSFKPFIYSAALERGFTPASVVNDAPVVLEDNTLDRAWRPENYTRRFYGPTRVREALAQSRNLVSIRVLRDIGVPYAAGFLERFGFPSPRMSPGLSLALGSAEVTPLELTAGYAVFANGGYRVEPYLVSRIESVDGEVVFRAMPALVCEDCAGMELDGDLEVAAAGTRQVGDALARHFRPAERAIPASNAYLMTSMMQDVIRNGTGQRAQQLGRGDIAGKTGTTNDLRDAWFAGYNRHLVTTAWVGFDESRNMGRGETGSRAALPMWIDFMRAALQDVPEEAPPRPSGLVSARIDPESGLLTSADNPRAIFELFQEGAVPERERRRESSGGSGSGRGGSSDPLF